MLLRRVLRSSMRAEGEATFAIEQPFLNMTRSERMAVDGAERMKDRVRACYVAAAIVVAGASSPALAQDFFASIPVSDVTLGENRGAYRPYSPSMSPFQLRAGEDVGARDDFRFFGHIGVTMMDVWWAEAGADLVAASRIR